MNKIQGDSGARQASIPHFHRFRQDVHFSARLFLVVLHLPRLPGPPPGAASGVPASSQACVKSKLRPYPLDGTARTSLHCTLINPKRMFFSTLQHSVLK